MDILIVDDEPLARERLARLLTEVADYRVVGLAANAIDMMTQVMQQDPDIVLLDIQMPGSDGLQAAGQLAALDDPPAVIFCTAYDQYALDAFGVNAVDYLLKPVRQEKLLQALQRAHSLNRAQRTTLTQAPEVSSRSHISARTRRGVERIALDRIHFFAADQKYVTIYHDDGETLIDDTLKELETELGQRFVRVHRNALVAVNRIEAMEKNPAGQFELRLQGTDQRPQVSRRHASDVRQRLLGD